MAPRSTTTRAVPAVPANVAAGLVAGTEYGLRGDVLAVHADNFAWVPDRSIDLVLTDPPFNIARDTTFHTYDANTINSYRFDKDKGWDSYDRDDFVALLGDWAAEFARVLRPGGHFAVFCADDYISHLKEALSAAGLKPRRTLTWRKPNAVPVNRKTMMMSACEYVLVGVKGANATFNSDLPCDNLAAVRDIETVLVADKAAAVVEKAVRAAVSAVSVAGAPHPHAIKDAVEAAVGAAAVEAAERVAAMFVEDAAGDWYLRGCVPNHVSFNSKSGKRLHSTEKPEPLLAYLVALLSRPGDVVLDPFGGSGSTAAAAADLGRATITLERDTEYFSKIVNRLELTTPPAAPDAATTGPLSG